MKPIFKSSIQHLEIALSFLTDLEKDEQACADVEYIFAMTEVGYALRDLPSDNDVSYWLVKEDFYQLAAALVNFEEEKRFDHFCNYLNRAIERLMNT